MSIFINTCLFPVGELDLINHYYDTFGDDICFEILSKFDDPNFEKDLDNLLINCPKSRFAFHEPVFLAEHSAKPGSEQYNKTMKMIDLTDKYARKLNAEHLVYHINNCKFDHFNRENLIKTSLKNLEEVKSIFNYLDIYFENVGIDAIGNNLFSQDEFCQLCKDKKFDVLIDIGHANANNWDLYKLIDCLGSQIKAFHIHNNDARFDLHNRIYDGTFNIDKFLTYSKKIIPNAKWIIEYIDPKYKGDSLKEDFKSLIKLQKQEII